MRRHTDDHARDANLLIAVAIFSQVVSFAVQHPH
jgi:hypothetical protein